MPDQQSSQDPAGNTDYQSSSVSQTAQSNPSPIQQGTVRNDGKCDSSQDQRGTNQLYKDVHWLQHAAFWSQIGLAVIGLAALGIYWGQLQQMIAATQASANAVDLARETLETNSSQFDRAMQRTIDQTISQYEATKASIKSAEAAKNAADTRRIFFTTLDRLS
jgi:hypothetical protein